MHPFCIQFGTTWASLRAPWTSIYSFGQVLEYVLRKETNSKGKQVTGEGNGGKHGFQGGGGGGMAETSDAGGIRRMVTESGPYNKLRCIEASKPAGLEVSMLQA